MLVRGKTLELSNHAEPEQNPCLLEGVRESKPEVPGDALNPKP